MIQEGKDGKSKLADAPVVLTASAFYLKSGFIGLSTDNADSSYFHDL